MDKRVSKVGPAGIDIAYQHLGNSDAPLVLLIMGLGGQSIHWPDAFCDALVNHGLQVIRFDNRDAGLSSHITDAPPPDLRAVLAGDLTSVSYTLSDMAADAVGLLSVLNLETAHVVGASMVGPFLPVLDEVVQKGTFFFVALTLRNLLQVSPRPEHLPLVVTAGRAWFAAHPDDTAFWVEYGVGRRLCSIIETIMRLDPKVFARNQAGRLEIESLLASLVRLGVSDAHLLEETIRQNDDDSVVGAMERRL